MIVGGDIDTIVGEPDYQPDKNSLVIKYFHIVERGLGLGQLWMKSVLMPYYQKIGYDRFSVGSSHPMSFKFYEKLGAKQIHTCEKESDHGLLTREVKVYRIDV